MWRGGRGGEWGYLLGRTFRVVLIYSSELNKTKQKPN
jgi:hypothetical protein